MLSHKGDKLNQVGEIHTKFKSQVIKGMCVVCLLFGWEFSTTFDERMLPHPWKIDHGVYIDRRNFYNNCRNPRALIG